MLQLQSSIDDSKPKGYKNIVNNIPRLAERYPFYRYLKMQMNVTIINTSRGKEKHRIINVR